VHDVEIAQLPAGLAMISRLCARRAPGLRARHRADDVGKDDGLARAGGCDEDDAA
jgi:hypothetical protein